MPLSFLVFTLKIIVFNRKYIAKITNPITKPVFDNYKADIYWNKISRKKRQVTMLEFFLCNI